MSRNSDVAAKMAGPPPPPPPELRPPKPPKSSAASPYDPLDARLGRTSGEPIETTKGKPVRSHPARKQSAATASWGDMQRCSRCRHLIPARQRVVHHFFCVRSFRGTLTRNV